MISKLPRLAGYRPFRSTSIAETALDPQLEQMAIPEDTIGHAWHVLDHATAKTTSTGQECPIWLPLVLFYASLVVWAKVRLSDVGKGKYGSLKLLFPFKLELSKMPWPCCTEMGSTLDLLMSR